jgi:hypothetical protein
VRERYQQISLHLQNRKPPFMVDFTFLDRGIRVRGDWYPIVRMEWVEGFTLNQFVKDNLDKPQILDLLCKRWLKLAGRLRKANIAHCDLQHGNVLLVPAAKARTLHVRLVDYDGMCVPALTLLKPIEVGHPAFQHPQRQRDGLYSLEVDRFSHLVIFTALRSLIVGARSLWDQFDNGDNLLFCRQDFEAPAKSRLFYTLLKLGDPGVRLLADRLIEAVRKPLEQAPLLEDVASAVMASPVSAAREARRTTSPGSHFQQHPAVPVGHLVDSRPSVGAGLVIRRARLLRIEGKKRWLLLAGAALAIMLGVVLFVLIRSLITKPRDFVKVPNPVSTIPDRPPMPPRPPRDPTPTTAMTDPTHPPQPPSVPPRPKVPTPVDRLATWRKRFADPDPAKRLTALQEGLAEPDPRIRREATASAIKEDAPALVPDLLQCLGRAENDVETRRNVASALAKFIGPGHKSAASGLSQAAKDNDAEVRLNAAVALANIGGANHEIALPVLAAALRPSPWATSVVQTPRSRCPF